MDNKSTFIKAIHDKKLVRITFDSNEKGRISRKVVPFDFGVSNRYKDGLDYYHTYDLESPDGNHNLAVQTQKMIQVELLSEDFDPATYVTWSPTKWHVPRDWGVYS